VNETERILQEYARRSHEIPKERYAAWNPAQILMVDSRRRAAAILLHELDAFPRSGEPCLEVGYGRLGWLSDLISWGLGAKDLHGIELSEERAKAARAALPGADLRVGDAAKIPWPDGTFRLVVVSTVFSSILDSRNRFIIADEIARVMAQGGALLWYDFTYNNPANPNVRGINKSEVRRLFPWFGARLRRVTLAPPVARAVAPRSWLLATFLESLPFLCSHLIGVLVKSR
jgi:ubiquinone/menaquinone biosynthesis C-methylase UbiE